MGWHTLCSSSYIVKDIITNQPLIGGSLGVLISKDDGKWPPRHFRVVKSEKHFDSDNNIIAEVFSKPIVKGTI